MSDNFRSDSINPHIIFLMQDLWLPSPDHVVSNESEPSIVQGMVLGKKVKMGIFHGSGLRPMTQSAAKNSLHQ